MTAKVSCFSLLRPRHGTEKLLRAASRSFVWEHLPQDAAISAPFAIDDTESVPEGLEDVSVNADKSVFVDCSKAGAETNA